MKIKPTDEFVEAISNNKVPNCEEFKRQQVERLRIAYYEWYERTNFSALGQKILKGEADASRTIEYVVPQDEVNFYFYMLVRQGYYVQFEDMQPYYNEIADSSLMPLAKLTIGWEINTDDMEVINDEKFQ